MANPIRPEDLPPVPALAGDDALIVDTGSGVYKTTPDEILEAADGVTSAALSASSGSSLAGFIQAGTGAVPRSAQSKLRDTISLFDFIDDDQHAAILDRTSTYDPTAAIQKAIDAAAASRRRLWIPAGLYNIVPATAFADEGSLGTKTAFLMRSYMDIEAEQGATFRIADGVSTDLAPQSMALFATNQVLNDIRITGLVMDMNGANNPISPNRIVVRTGTISVGLGSAAVTGVGTSFTTQAQAGWTLVVGGVSYVVQSVTNNTSLTLTTNASAAVVAQPYSAGIYKFFNQSQVYVSGTPAGVAARIDRALITDCEFVNNPGVSCLCMAQSNVPGTVLGTFWTVLRNRFYNNGSDSIDHSSVYAWANDVLFKDNVVYNDTAYGPTGGVACYEVHGSRQRIVNNLFRRFFRGMWVADNYTAPCVDTLIEGNSFDQMKAYGVEFFGVVPTALNATRTRIVNNDFTFDNNTHQQVDLKGAIGISSPTLAQVGIEIVGNRATPTGYAVASAGVIIGSATAASQLHDRILIEGNVWNGTTFGSFIKTNATNGLGTISIRNNRGYNLTAQTSGAYLLAMGLFVSFNGSASQIGQLILEGNEYSETRSSGAERMAYGTFLQGSILLLSRRLEATRGATTSAYLETGLTVTVRQFQDSGWTAGTGTGNKGAFTSYAGVTMDAGYNQTKAQASDDAAKAASQRLLSIEGALRAQGIIV